ncbi:DMT family transporter [Dictyobacter formicarum]|uniref:Membrane protein n=1 Tax=Dictyobacter formicarum TaxID=2778368 RepID=A0ABQ3V8K3_9CHLR|nr:DMT family transporter [Dictyobacter formicarum]GHO82153.1 membrane protein [Dictyobacter formicarum]
MYERAEKVQDTLKGINVKARGFILTLLTTCMFGLGAVLGKIVAADMQPMLVSFLDLFVGGILLGIILLIAKIPLWPQLQKTDWVNLWLLAVIGTALPLVCIVTGLAQTSAIKGGFLLQMQGLITVICAIIFLRERMAWKHFGGIACLLFGSLLVIIKNLDASLWEAFSRGDLLIVAGAAGLGYSMIPAKKLSIRIHSLPLNVWRLLLGAIVLLPFLFIQPHTFTFTLTSTLLWALPVYIITNFCIGYITLQEGLRFLKAWESAAIMQTMPIFSTIFAILLLHDTISWLQIVGGAIILIGGFILARASEANNK